MELNYNATGERRKELVKAISQITGEKAVYKFVPTCAYEIGPFSVSKEGILSFDDNAYKQARDLTSQLEELGFAPETEEAAAGEEPAADAPQEAEPAADAEDPSEAPAAEANEAPQTAPEGEAAEDEGPTGLSISLPDELTDAEFENLTRLVESKQTLMKEAFKSEGIMVSREDGKVTFSGFTASDGDHTAAYMAFATLMVRMAKAAKRVTGKDHDAENRKYAFRCFLLRIGMIGDEYKAARKILLENLTGSSAFRDGKRKEAEA